MNSSPNTTQNGFSYIDVMIAIVILSVGILALLSALSASVLQARGESQQVKAKQIATSTMESILSVKETDPTRLGWNAIGNIGSNLDDDGIPHGIFPTGFQSVLSDPGADEVIGTADDTGSAMQGFQRQIVVTDVCDPSRPSPICSPPGTSKIRFRTVEVTITYFVGSLQRQEILRTVLTDYAVVN